MREEQLPKHEASLHITHNQHKAYYMPIADYIAEEKIDDDEWSTPDSKERCIAGDTIWEIQWYPNTPVGFNKMYGATLEELIKAANEV